eukprot:gene1057-1392_t
MNILVATPGRLLQHMDETPGFEPSSLQVLVLDEADRILDMGFAATLDAILANLPQEGRQTLLFSATQTKSVRDLARLSLDEPEYLAVHSEAAAPTPLKLKQAYMVVRFVYESFRKLRPGTPLRSLHGGMKQGKRMAVYEAFNSSSSGGGGGVLFATDIAARGLDFPDVDWVVQADCPEDVAAYIHSELKAFAQSALVAHVRSVFLQPNKAVFDAAALPIDEYAESLGLLAAPQLKFLKRVGKKVVSEVVLGGAAGQPAATAAAAAGSSDKQQGQLEQLQRTGKRKRALDPEEEAGSEEGLSGEDGQQLDPLELLAMEGLGQQLDDEAAAVTVPPGSNGSSGLHVVAGAAEDRFQQAAQLMRQRDLTDKKVLAALRKQAKLEKKLKRRAAAEAEADDMAPTLGGGDPGSEGEEVQRGEPAAAYDDGSSDDAALSPREQQGRRRVSLQVHSAGKSGSSSDGSDDAAAAPDAAYLGMARKSAWILLSVLVVLGNEDANDCHFLLSCVCVLFLGIPVSSRKQHSRPKQRAANMDRALRQMLQSFPIEDISPFSSDDEFNVQADVQGCSSRVYSSSVNNASDADAVAQVNASYQSSGLAPKQLQKQSLYTSAPVTAAVPVSPPVTCMPASPLKWNTRLSDRATAEVNLEAHYKLPPNTLFDLLADPFVHDKIFDAILKKWRLDYRARWNFWRVSGVCENRMFMWTNRETGSITFKLREPGFLKKPATLSGAAAPAVVDAPAPGLHMSPLASMSVSGTPAVPGLTGAVAAIARMQAGLQDSVATTVNNSISNLQSSAAAVQALSKKAGAPWGGIRLGSLSGGSNSDGSEKIAAARPRRRRPLPTAAIITVASFTSPRITPPYPLNQTLKVQSKGQISDMLEGLVAAAAAKLQVQPLHAE